MAASGGTVDTLRFFGMPKWLQRIPEIIHNVVNQTYGLHIPTELLQANVCQLLYEDPIEQGCAFYGHCHQFMDLPSYVQEPRFEPYTESTNGVRRLRTTYAMLLLLTPTSVDNEKLLLDATFVWPEWNAIAVGDGSIDKNGKMVLTKDKYHEKTGSSEDLALGGRYDLQLNIAELLDDDSTAKPRMRGGIDIVENGKRYHEEDCIDIERNGEYFGLTVDELKEIAAKLKMIPNRVYFW